MIEIPSHMRRVLKRDSKFERSVTHSLGTFEPLLRDNKLIFFPEYTDHGIEHLEGVMRTADALIRDRAWKVITPSDVATLILACLLHDVAMHLTRDGFAFLVTADMEWRIIAQLEDRPWYILWADFLAEAKRFDDRTLTRLFGSPDPVKMPELSPEAWTDNQLKLIGEFIRRHHHRLAHQIGINGMPGPAKDRLRLRECDEDVADIAGLVARSHGMPLRDSIPYLENKYHARLEHKGIHAVFLMAVLRVADYLQVEAERAPNELLRVKRLRSPISQREWRAHSAIRDIKNVEDDIEALYVFACPEDVGTYLRLKDLLKGIQSELDTSWAVIGEVYSRYTKEKLDSLGLSIRRVTSNLYDEKGFAEAVQYIPCHVVFDTAGAELMKLLVKPLYGDSPNIGIRELLQNAVDAVRELNELLKMRDDLQDIQRPNQEADVLIALKQEEDGTFWLVVSDRGIGMTADTIQNYFLKAGACLRHSIHWRQTFEDETGKSRVLRSGRFGIGVFAAFLLGKRICVSTRHPDSEHGLEFDASVDDESIELRKITREVGTAIKVRLDDGTAHRLLHDTADWDWYVLEEPSVSRKTERGIIDQSVTYPGPCSVLPPEWHRISYDGFQDVHWAYTAGPALACNGIVVVRACYSTESRFIRSGPTDRAEEDLNHGVPETLKFELPQCSCFDPDGVLPLNLQRTDITRPYPFMADLRDNVLEDLLAYVLVMAPAKPISDPSSLRRYFWAVYPGLSAAHWMHDWTAFEETSNYLPLVSTPGGVTLCDPWLLNETRRDSVMELHVVYNCYEDPLYLRQLSELDNVLEQYPIVKVGLYLVDVSCPLPSIGVKILMKRDRLSTELPEGLERFLTRRGRSGSSLSPAELEMGDEWIVRSAGRCAENGFDFRSFTEEKQQLVNTGFAIVEWFLDARETAHIKPSIVSQYWMDIIGIPAIPYDLAERRERLSHAYERLGKYVKAWESVCSCEAQEPDTIDC